MVNLSRPSSPGCCTVALLSERGGYPSPLFRLLERGEGGVPPSVLACNSATVASILRMIELCLSVFASISVVLRCGWALWSFRRVLTVAWLQRLGRATVQRFQVLGGGQYPEVVRHGIAEDETRGLAAPVFEVLEVALFGGPAHPPGGSGLVEGKLTGDCRQRDGVSLGVL